ncbi:MAG TPA: hypothetical protein DDY77_05220 [Clostridiales bacterium]|nr:hypothetical protein [Clostridiales bacterium]
MKFLHTSDWHIGKKLEGRTRLEEQKTVLGSIVKIAKEEEVDVVLVAGDIFDTFTPSAEAEQLFFDVVSSLSALGAAVVIIAGNHDDPVRLSASASLAEKCNVYFYGEEQKLYTGSESRVKCDERGKDYIVFSNGGERVYVALLPYPTELRMKEKLREDETYAEKVKRYIDEATSNNAENLPIVLVSHLFMLGGEKSDGERAIDLGGARIVPPSVIGENVIYSALGHLHKRQVVSRERNIIYSGSPLQYAFDEASYEKSVNVFSVEKGAVEGLKTIPLDGYKKLLRTTLKSCEEAEKFMAEAGDTFIEIMLELSAPPSSEELKRLVGSYPNAVLRINYSSGEKAVKSRTVMGSEELFKEYYKSRYNEEVPADMLELFLKCVHDTEVEDETDSY